MPAKSSNSGDLLRMNQIKVLFLLVFNCFNTGLRYGGKYVTKKWIVITIDLYGIKYARQDQMCVQDGKTYYSFTKDN